MYKIIGADPKSSYFLASPPSVKHRVSIPQPLKDSGEAPGTQDATLTGTMYHFTPILPFSSLIYITFSFVHIELLRGVSVQYNVNL